MKITKFLLGGFGGLALICSLFACSSSGRSVSKADFCPTNFDPISIEKALASPSYSNKIDFKTGNEDVKFDETGEFEYVSSQVYYLDRARDLKILFSHKKNAQKDKDGKETYTAKVDCVGGKGWKVGMTPVVVDVPIASDLIIEEDKDNKDSDGNPIYLTSYKVRYMHLKLEPSKTEEWYQYPVDVEPVAVYDGLPVSLLSLQFPEAKQFFLKVKNSNARSPHDLLARVELPNRNTPEVSNSNAINAPQELRIITRVEKKAPGQSNTNSRK